MERHAPFDFVGRRYFDGGTCDKIVQPNQEHSEETDSGRLPPLRQQTRGLKEQSKARLRNKLSKAMLLLSCLNGIFDHTSVAIFEVNFIDIEASFARIIQISEITSVS